MSKHYRIQVRSTGFVLGYQNATDEQDAIRRWRSKGSIGYTADLLVAVLL